MYHRQTRTVNRRDIACKLLISNYVNIPCEHFFCVYHGFIGMQHFPHCVPKVINQLEANELIVCFCFRGKGYSLHSKDERFLCRSASRSAAHQPSASHRACAPHARGQGSNTAHFALIC